ncbi:MAG: DHH family phosphoesterase [Lachnospiraceae bacterium]|nr:DHH family phosphoesterase [Lachnospiraceae bacterium]
MNSKLKLKGKIITYLFLPVILGGLLLIGGAALALESSKLGMIIMIVAAIYIIVTTVLYFYSKPVIMRDLVEFAVDYAQIQKSLLQDLALPYGLLDSEGKLLWKNKELDVIIDDKGENHGKEFLEIFSDITLEAFRDNDYANTFNIEYRDRSYRIECNKIEVHDLFVTSKYLEISDPDECLVAVYFYDETEIKKLIKENIEQRMVSGLIYIDNYEEALESVEDVRKSLLTALIERKINQFVQNVDGVVKKLEKDKFFFIFKYKHLENLQADKFSILDEVKTVNIGNEMAMTISVGMGVGGETYIQNNDYARTAMDLALGRGGDQAVIKDNDRIYYYGGKSRQVEKNTRVKARVKAHALRETIASKEKVIIMGHQIGDIDSLGAAIGLYRAMKALGKKAHIVLNEVTVSLRPIVERFISDTEYEEDLFIKSEDAVNALTKDTVVIIVDVNRPSRTECPELLNMCKSVVVLDHHRQTGEVIENAVLSYIEPFASSTCEMVAEILQYIQDGIKLRQPEADALYGGIMIDTNNFTQKTGVRTFEAAAFLRRSGADVVRVRKMFRDNLTEYKVRAKAVSRAEIFCEKFAISDFTATNIESPTVVCAQAANELLNITGVDASFVLTEYDGKIYISARSIDDINVQLIMERIGGGGHMNIAGAQIEDMDMEDAKEMLMRTVKTMVDNNDI